MKKVKVKYYSMYSQSGCPWWEDVPTEEEADVLVFTDIKCYEVINTHTNKKKIAFMIEPRCFDGFRQEYEFVEKNWQLYDLILTHDSILLEKCPNAKLMYWGSVWDYNDIPKTKMISMLCSDKDWCELHHKRIEVAKVLKDSPLVDCFGNFDGGNNVDTYTAHAEYMYAIAIENYIEDYWFTEKIFNCFANKTIPIYYGSPKITEYFNPDGIIIANSPEEIIDKIDNYSASELTKMYYEKAAAINDNYNRVRTFDNFFNRLYMMYHREFGL